GSGAGPDPAALTTAAAVGLLPAAVRAAVVAAHPRVQILLQIERVARGGQLQGLVEEAIFVAADVAERKIARVLAGGLVATMGTVDGVERGDEVRDRVGHVALHLIAALVDVPWPPGPAPFQAKATGFRRRACSGSDSSPGCRDPA